MMWFRRDLRVLDNPALRAAMRRGSVLALFVVDPVLLGSSGGPRLRFLRESLDALCVATSGRLVVRVGNPVDVVPTLAAEFGIAEVFVSRDYTPYGRRRDRTVSERLQQQGAALRGIGSPYSVAPGTVVKPDGNPYAVFTPFWRNWKRVLSEGGDGVTLLPRSGRTDEDETLGAASFVEAAGDEVMWPERSRCDTALPVAGEVAAWDRWAWFREHGLAGYGERRNTPSEDGTSRLSTYLRWGTIHPSQLIAECDGSPEAESFVRELCWREFYAEVLYRRPETAWRNLDGRFDRMEVDTDDSALERFAVWQQGRTGFPIVDAGMRQLAATGWMHNRVRMITASFLVKDLHLPWQWGARYFMDQLVDGDLASNNHGWQWVAGCGTDAAPYHRIMNPTLQGEKFDPAGEYAQQWIAEWPLVSPPMVDHAVERAESLRRRAAISVA